MHAQHQKENIRILFAVLIGLALGRNLFANLPNMLMIKSCSVIKKCCNELKVKN